MVNIKDYESRWDYMADKVGHPRRPILDQEPTPFQITGRFVGNWEAELQYLLEATKSGEAYNFLAKKTKDDSAAGYKTKALNEFDMDKMDLTKEYEFVKKIRTPELEEHREHIPTIWKMVDWFGFTGEIVANIHVQQPGHVFPFHFDNLITVRGKKAILDDGEAERYGRVEVMLRDWEYGHIWGVGNTYWTNWHKGEIMYHPWHNVPHGTANAGRYPRINLQVTGTMTPELEDKLNKNNGDIFLD